MIVTRLMGGLGNQMFQYAVGRRISLLRNTELQLDDSYLKDSSKNHALRTYELAIFSLNGPMAKEEDINRFSKRPGSKLKRLVSFNSSYHTINERMHSYDSSILKSPKNSLLIGFWQTEKYFSQIEGVIRKDFTFKKELDGLNAKMAADMAQQNSISMHIRRGDYVNNPETQNFHGNCSPEYYTNALKLIKESVKDVHVYVFSDDISWVKANMDFDVPTTYVEQNNGENSYIDMQLMSLCKHNIIANSSFSWWGAWLNSSPGKIVVAPAKWFNSDSIDAKDIIPERWLKL